MSELLSLEFFQRALLAVCVGAPLLGLLAPIVVARKMAFFSTAIGQSTLTGVALGVAAGESLDGPSVSVFAFSLLIGFALVFLKRTSKLPTDTLVGVLLAFTLGLGVCLLVVVTKRFNIHQLEASMFGSVLTVTWVDLALLTGVGAAVLVFLKLKLNVLIIDTVDESLARVHGINSRNLEYALVGMLTLLIVVCVKILGALMVEAMLVIPAAAARLVTRSMPGLMLGSTLTALVTGVSGVFLSAVLNVPSGAAMVLTLSAAFGIALLGSRLRASDDPRDTSSAP